MPPVSLSRISALAHLLVVPDFDPLAEVVELLLKLD